MLLIHDLVNITETRPSQWKAKTVDNGSVYIRYGGGYLLVGIGKTFDEAMTKALIGDTFLSKQMDENRRSSEMETEDMLRFTGLVVIRFLGSS